jgi:methylmalonyl-CoA/ethylmalonyl-CoA epimerase
MILGIDHLGVAVESLESALRFWQGSLGMTPEHAEAVAAQGVRTVLLPANGVRIELLEPTGPETPVGRFLARRGPGLHHVCLLVDDLDAALRELAASGLRLIDPVARAGVEGSRIAFLHPEAGAGVLVELKETVRR